MKISDLTNDNIIIELLSLLKAWLGYNLLHNLSQIKGSRLFMK